MPLVTVTVHDDPAELLAAARPLIAAEPVLHSVLATNAERISQDRAISPDARWYLLHRGGRLVGVAMWTPPYPPHLPLRSDELALALARELAATGAAPDGVGGLKDAAITFSDWWCREHDLDADVEMDQGMYDLPVAPRLPWPVAGRLRVAIPEDLGLVQGWLEDFAREAMPARERSVDASPLVLGGRTALWEVDGRPVSMCNASVGCEGVTRISWVWTPPSERGHGYASAVVAGWSEEQRRQGLRCMLYTDLANPTSNGIYQAIGYRQVAESVLLSFSTRLSG